MKFNSRFLVSIFLLVSILSVIGAAIAEAIDVSDPVKFYTYAGGGLKFTDYTNGATLNEIGAKGNLGLSKRNMIL